MQHLNSFVFSSNKEKREEKKKIDSPHFTVRRNVLRAQVQEQENMLRRFYYKLNQTGIDVVKKKYLALMQQTMLVLIIFCVTFNLSLLPV